MTIVNAMVSAGKGKFGILTFLFQRRSNKF